METSYKFKNIENNLLKLLDILQQNENLKKYIVCLVDDPLSQSNVSQDLIESGHIVLNIFDENVVDKQKIKIFINPLEGDLRYQPIGEVTFLFDIIIPTSKWKINNSTQLRAFRIADEIAQDIDQKKVAGAGEVEVTKFRIYKLNQNYSGLSLWVNVKSTTVKGLR
jgi:hypothetical protein